MFFAARVAVLTVLGPQFVMAQAPLGAATLAGTVTDPGGLVVAGAEVVLTEGSKGLERHTTSSESGSFLFLTIEPGTYTLLVGKPGFETCRFEDVDVAVGQRRVLDVTLVIGDVRSVVRVSTDDQGPVDTESNVIGTVVDSARVRDLPLNG